MRRWAPWLLGLALLALLVLLASGSAEDRDPWIAPLSILFGLAIAAQAIDALRTGQLKGWFPNAWPLNASRIEEPFFFWLGVLLYFAYGLMFAGIGLLVIVSWLTA